MRYKVGVVTNFELGLLDALQNLRNPGLDKFMVTISTLGNGSIIWISMIIIFLSTKEYNSMGKIMVIAFIANVLIVNLVLKNIVGRVRPYEYVRGLDLLVPALSDGSFPSGHSSYAASFATIVLLLVKGKTLKIFTTTLALLIAISRLYLHVHFPTDVIAGLIIGFVIATLSIKFYYSAYFKELKINLQKNHNMV